MEPGEGKAGGADVAAAWKCRRDLLPTLAWRRRGRVRFHLARDQAANPRRYGAAVFSGDRFRALLHLRLQANRDNSGLHGTFHRFPTFTTVDRR